MSRGSFIITQKENKGEYHGIHCITGATDCHGGYINNGSTWYWTDGSADIYAHVFDQNGKNGTTDNIPIRYANNTTDYHTTNNIPQCTSDYNNSTTLANRATGLYGNNNQKISNQVECKPNTLNAGNYYNFPAATAGSNNGSTSAETNMANSICPKGWRLPPNDDKEKKSYNNLIRTAYRITATNSDSQILSSPLSFVRLGHYGYDYGSLIDRGYGGHYWSSTAYSDTLSHYLDFNSGFLYPQLGYNRALGFSVRCVSR